MSKKSDLDSVLKPISTATGLPNQHYTDEILFQEEKISVLHKNWTAIGFGKDVETKGDAKPVNFMGLPLLIVRDDEGDINVFQNTCRHRGMILVNEQTKIRGPIRCPYHSWSYSLKGDLRATPHTGGPGQSVDPTLKSCDLGLIQIRNFVWRDIIFVNISNDAPEFSKTHADLINRWKEFDQPIQHGGASSSYKLEIETNWKLAVENYCEAYHLPWIHPDLNVISRIEDHYPIEQPGYYSGQGTLVYQQIKNETGDTLPDFTNLSEKWDQGAEYITLYPNVLLGISRDHSFSIILEPVSTDKTIEHVELYYPPHTTNDEVSDLRDQNAAAWRKVFEEDIFVVEGMQRGRMGMFFDGGKFVPTMDGPTHTFHQWVATQILNGRAT